MSAFRKLLILILVLTGIAALNVSAASAAPVSQPPSGAYCVYAWASIAGHPEYISVGGQSFSPGNCTTKVSVYCASGYWNGWVTLNITAGGGLASRNSNPCAVGDTVTAVFYREEYPFGRLCWFSGKFPNTWEWNYGTPTSLCNG